MDKVEMLIDVIGFTLFLSVPLIFLIVEIKTKRFKEDCERLCMMIHDVQGDNKKLNQLATSYTEQVKRLTDVINREVNLDKAVNELLNTKKATGKEELKKEIKEILRKYI